MSTKGRAFIVECPGKTELLASIYDDMKKKGHNSTEIAEAFIAMGYRVVFCDDEQTEEPKKEPPQ